MKAKQSCQCVSLSIIETEIGYFGAAAGEYGLICTLLPQAQRSAILEELTLSFPGGKWEENGTLKRLADDIMRYAKSEIVSFTEYELDLQGFTPFQRQVLEAARKIPYGSRLSYRQVAQEAGKPLAARAVGQVMAHNPLPLIIPCHRVVGSHGLGGFSSPDGLAKKQMLLTLEERGRQAQTPN